MSDCQGLTSKPDHTIAYAEYHFTRSATLPLPSISLITLLQRFQKRLDNIGQTCAGQDSARFPFYTLSYVPGCTSATVFGSETYRPRASGQIRKGAQLALPPVDLSNTTISPFGSWITRTQGSFMTIAQTFPTIPCLYFFGNNI